MKQMRRIQLTAATLLLSALLLAGCSKSESNDPTTVTATFSADKVNGNSPLIVKFTNTSANATSYEWSFGDGSTSKEQDPTHTFSNSSFTEPKSFTVSLTSTGANGATASTSVVITVNKLIQGALTASFTADKETGETPLTIQFTNTSTGAVSYQWDFGDGQYL
jgi:PKD repeat protein